MSKLAIISRPITDSSNAYLLLKNDDHVLERHLLKMNDPLLITVNDPSKKYCVGWYDVTTHTNHVCEGGREVDVKYDSCFECRQKTGFNPAFYNTSEISSVQQNYNNKPHSVYVSYFGNGIAKAGIMSDSRGLERLFEQGALFYYIVGTFENADAAHKIESTLINKGLKNSVTKRQKEKALSMPLDEDIERQVFSDILGDLELSKKKIVSNLERFFFGNYPSKSIEPIGDNPISGAVRAVVGRYLILNNNDRLYGFWLSSLSGFEVEVSNEVKEIKAEPEQVSLFG
jgi:Protein of unknown function (DUF2797)